MHPGGWVVYHKTLFELRGWGIRQGGCDGYCAPFDAFVQGAPCTVLTRLIAERIVDDQLLRALFREHAVTQYDRDITITHLVEGMLDVARGMVPSVRAGFLRRQEDGRLRSRPFTASSIEWIPSWVPTTTHHR